MDRPIVACVLAGGTGTRLYPASTSDRPKQFRSFGGDRSLLVRTVERAGFADEVYVLTREAFAEQVDEILSSANGPTENVTVLVEPEAKDTGPALVYAAHRVTETVGECVLLTLPSDHYVGSDDAFEAEARKAARVASETGGLVTIGIEPTRAATGYGYLKPDTEGEGEHTTVETFREKPDPGAAARYVHHGYLWNAGIFAWTPEALLDAARETELAPLVEALDAGDSEKGFAAVPSVSVDHAVLEGAASEGKVYLVRATFEWDDLGTWDAFERVYENDEDGNTLLGDILAIDTAGTVVASDADTHVSVLGISDLVVAAYGDRVLVAPKHETQRVREIVAELRERDLF